MADRIDTRALLDRVDIVKVIDGYVSLRKSGKEYEACCPFHTEATPSFKVSPAKQIYQCFGCGANGDAIKFLEEFKGATFHQACEELAGGIGVPSAPGSYAAKQPTQAPAREKERSPWSPMLPVPEKHGRPPSEHRPRGKPERVWAYRDGAGALLGYVYRFVTSDGGKEVLPLTWCQHAETGMQEWRWMAFPEPRPLYGLDELAKRPNAKVVLVEGEKCKDAGQAQLPDVVVVSWPGGGKAVGKVDWSPLFGRVVIQWADCDAKREKLTPEEELAVFNDPRLQADMPRKEREALIKALRVEHAEAIKAAQQRKPLLPERDQPGVKTMDQIAEILLSNGSKVYQVSIPAAGDVADGWDIANAVDEGMVGQELTDYILSGLVEVPPKRDDPPAKVDSAPPPPGAPAGGGSGGPDDPWRKMLLRKDDRLIDCRENVYLILKHHPAWSGVLWVDEFARKIVKRKPTPWDDRQSFCPDREWSEDDDLRLGLWLAQRERLIVRSADVLSASVGWLARENPWHPVREYLDGLEWDRQERVSSWLTDYLGARPNEYTVLSGRLALISMVARIYKPGCQMRSMPILEGPQFKGKSTAIRILGGQWYSDAPIDLGNKDTYQIIQGVWLHEIAELDAFNKAESTRIKAFVSSCIDRFRAPYDRAPKDWPRSTVFMGTTNHDEYFKDSTGNTRYWPWLTQELGAIDHDGLERTRDQLLAEAVDLFKRGERWHPTPDEQTRLFEPEQSKREIGDLWEIKIHRFLLSRAARRITALEILEECLGVEIGKVDSARQMSTRIGQIMHRLTWTKKRETGGSRDYYYVAPAGWGGDL